MRKKFLTFDKRNDGHFIIMNKGQPLGCIESKGIIFSTRAVSTEFERDLEMTSECHRQIADKLDSLEGVVSPSASDNSTMAEILPQIDKVLWGRGDSVTKVQKCKDLLAKLRQ